MQNSALAVMKCHQILNLAVFQLDWVQQCVLLSGHDCIFFKKTNLCARFAIVEFMRITYKQVKILKMDLS